MNTKEITIDDKISLYFKFQRESSGMSRAELSEKLNVDKTIVVNYELLRNSIQLPVLIELLRIFTHPNTTILGFVNDLSFVDFNPESVESVRIDANEPLSLSEVEKSLYSSLEDMGHQVLPVSSSDIENVHSSSDEEILTTPLNINKTEIDWD